MTISPMPGKLLVKRLSPPTLSEGGIVLVHSTPRHEDLQRGVVLAVGSDTSDIGEGDTVVFPYRAGEEFVVDAHKVLLMLETDVRAVEEAVE